MNLFFVSSSEFKAREVREILKPSGVDLVVLDVKIQEILDVNLEAVVRDKCLKAFERVRLPLAVEHGALCIDELNGLPGGLSKPVWDTINGKLCDLIPPGSSRAATHRVMVAHCDGRRVRVFEGSKRGTISTGPRGDYKFQYDPIFIPAGADKTLAEIGFPGKLVHSPTPDAWAKLVGHLQAAKGPAHM